MNFIGHKPNQQPEHGTSSISVIMGSIKGSKIFFYPILYSMLASVFCLIYDYSEDFGISWKLISVFSILYLILSGVFFFLCSCNHMYGGRSVHRPILDKLIKLQFASIILGYSLLLFLANMYLFFIHFAIPGFTIVTSDPYLIQSICGTTFGLLAVLVTMSFTRKIVK